VNPILVRDERISGRRMGFDCGGEERTATWSEATSGGGVVSWRWIALRQAFRPSLLFQSHLKGVVFKGLNGGRGGEGGEDPVDWIDQTTEHMEEAAAQVGDLEVSVEGRKKGEERGAEKVVGCWVNGGLINHVLGL